VFLEDREGILSRSPGLFEGFAVFREPNAIEDGKGHARKWQHRNCATAELGNYLQISVKFCGNSDHSPADSLPEPRQNDSKLNGADDEAFNS
jgi:hypothetical protein